MKNEELAMRTFIFGRESNMNLNVNLLRKFGTSGICVEEGPISLFDRASPVRCAGETPTIPADVLSE